MKRIFKVLLGLMLFMPSVYAQKAQIKEAQKELKSGNSELVLAILAPVEYLIPNADEEDKINFYYLKSYALVDLANKSGNTFKSQSTAITALNDLIETEQMFSVNKYTSEAFKTLGKIKTALIKSANEDVVSQNFAESGNKFYQAYMIDKKDTLQLYNAAVSFKNGNDDASALKSYEELKQLNYKGNITVFTAYNKSLQKEESFATMQERDAKVKTGLYIKPMQKVKSQKEEVYKSLALIYMDKGYKEKALKYVVLARSLNNTDSSLAILEANLYLQTKEYELFDKLATEILDANPNNGEIAMQFGVSCQNEKYFQGAENYYKKAIETDPKLTQAYIGISQLLTDKTVAITAKMNKLSSSASDKTAHAELKSQKDQLVKTAIMYLQKAISIDPTNSNAKQMLTAINPNGNFASGSIAAEE
jgi:tetratricopeptide (TPR) repeat protein